MYTILIRRLSLVFAFILFLIPMQAFAAGGDLNSDGKIDVTDLGILLSNWGGSGTADINNDGKIDVTDLGILLSNWGSGATPPPPPPPPGNPSSSLSISSDNPHYFTYKGKPIFLTSSGSGNDLLYSKNSLLSNRQNNARITTWIYDSHICVADQRPYKGCNMKKGFSKPYWDRLRSDVQWAFDNDVMVGIVIQGTSILETCSMGRWGGHAWNSNFGGPITAACNGKDQFYDLFDYNNPIRGPYDESWPWQKKNQFRQEELINKVFTDLDFPNLYPILMWEMHDTGGTSRAKAEKWWKYMANYIHKMRPGTLVTAGEASGVSCCFGGGLISSWVMNLTGLDFMVFQNRPTGHFDKNDLKAVKDAYWNLNIPFVHIGTRWVSSGETIPSSEHEDVRNTMRKMMLYGFQPAAPFGGYQQAGSQAYHSYAKTLQEFADTVETWCDEPGQEITNSTLPPINGGVGIDLPRGSCNDGSI